MGSNISGPSTDTGEGGEKLPLSVLIMCENGTEMATTLFCALKNALANATAAADKECAARELPSQRSREGGLQIQ